MNRKQTNMYNMFLTVKEFLDRRRNIWNSVIAFVTNKDRFDTLVDSIAPLRQVQENDKTGVALDKRNKANSLINVTLEISASVRAFALDNNNNTMANQVSFSFSELARQNDTALINKARLVWKLANENIDVLKRDYNLSEASMNALAEITNAYASIVESPRSAITESSTATINLLKAVDETKEVLTKIDALVNTFASKDPDFVTQYYEARKIVDFGFGKPSASNAPPPAKAS